MCNPGYSLDQAFGECKPVCNPPCIKGGCAAPNRCVCFDGYTLLPGSRYHCLQSTPVCSPSCVNGVCVDHNQCECDKGFISRPEAPFLCIPAALCYPGFENGNRTFSYFGLRRLCGVDPLNEHVCEPKCVNGTCIARNRCQCNEGFVYDKNHVCIPACKSRDNCINRTCTDPATCVQQHSCNEGFTFNPGRKICVPTSLHNIGSPENSPEASSEGSLGGSSEGSSEGSPVGSQQSE